MPAAPADRRRLHLRRRAQRRRGRRGRRRQAGFSRPAAVLRRELPRLPDRRGACRLGCYDPARASWVPGRRAAGSSSVLGAANGLASLDVDGAGGPAARPRWRRSASRRRARQLAALYPPGQRLWRVPIRPLHALGPQLADRPGHAGPDRRRPTRAREPARDRRRARPGQVRRSLVPEPDAGRGDRRGRNRLLAPLPERPGARHQAGPARCRSRSAAPGCRRRLKRDRARSAVAGRASGRASRPSRTRATASPGTGGTATADAPGQPADHRPDRLQSTAASTAGRRPARRRLRLDVRALRPIRPAGQRRRARAGSGRLPRLARAARAPRRDRRASAAGRSPPLHTYDPGGQVLYLGDGAAEPADAAGVGAVDRGDLRRHRRPSARRRRRPGHARRPS